MEHVIEMHNSEFECRVCCVFRMNVREVHTNAMERQLTEAVKIENIERPSLNRKRGYDVTRPRIFVLHHFVTSLEVPQTCEDNFLP